MTVENAGAVRHPTRAAHAGHAAANRGAATAAGANDAPAAGFLSLLGAVSDGSDLLDPAALTLDGAVDDGTALSGQTLARDAAEDGTDDASTLAAWSGWLQMPVVVPPTTPTTPATGAAPGVSTTLADTTGKPAGLRSLAADGFKADSASPVATTASTVATEVAQSTSANPAAAGKAPIAADAARPAAPPAGAQALRVGSLSAVAAASRAHAAATADALSAQVNSISVGGTAAVTDPDGRSARGTASTLSLGDGGQGRWSSMLSDIVRAPAESATGGFGENGAQSQHHGADAQARGGEGLGTTAAGFGQTAAGTDGGAFSAASAPTPGADMPMAGTANVLTQDEWLAATTPSLESQGLQTAELTVDAFGAPVDVRISLSGADAEVSFQTDQADTRAALGGAVSELQNLLQQEGLVLSGVTVGGSGAQQQQGGFQATADGGGSRGDTRRAARADAGQVETVAEPVARSRPTTGRGALDVFA
ncbi:flagellar hook-length control protein FliK [Xylophilus sp. GOD-11R]|uniref:flagellar hook-length control protein FliK n=1 Tax=Xylophilus sp. GOD-11R TaxID=3089814 RepID=UPI00298CBAA2|nr:flagellar hook-length control protein FliK [Xylophilus sp. GOD-11R]WPB57783.1 flagellar hook-length control protein FliK [Xylophilus sp. GOD-11R]